MASRSGAAGEAARLLEHLMALEYDAEETCRVAAEHLADPRYLAPMADIGADHLRRLRELEPLVRRLGGTPPGSPDLRGRLEEVRLLFAQLGGDDAILRTLRTEAERLAAAYERALETAPMPAREALARGRDDERQHAAWIDGAVKSLEAAPHRGAPPWNIPPPSGL